MTKNEMRKEILARRLDLSDSDVSFRSEAICRRLIVDEVFTAASVIGLYWPFKNEVLTGGVFWAALSEHKRVGFPVVRAEDRSIVYISVDDPADMAVGTYGIMEPRFVPERVIPIEEFDLIVVPGIAFDDRGYRIGYGGGYFDRLLSGSGIAATLSAMVFDFQIVDRIPHEEYDRKVEIIFTESRVIMCS